METNNQDQVKDLLHFKELEAENQEYEWATLINSIIESKSVEANAAVMIMELAAERYAAHLVQQAKDAAFKEGVKSERIRVRKILKSHYPGAKMDSQTVLSVLHDNAPMPYTTGEKGGVGINQTT